MTQTQTGWDSKRPMLPTRHKSSWKPEIVQSASAWDSWRPGRGSWAASEGQVAQEVKNLSKSKTILSLFIVICLPLNLFFKRHFNQKKNNPRFSQRSKFFFYKKPFKNSNIIKTLKLPLLKMAELLLVMWIFHPFRKSLCALSLIPSLQPLSSHLLKGRLTAACSGPWAPP